MKKHLYLLAAIPLAIILSFLIREVNAQDSGGFHYPVTSNGSTYLKHVDTSWGYGTTTDQILYGSFTHLQADNLSATTFTVLNIDVIPGPLGIGTTTPAALLGIAGGSKPRMLLIDAPSGYTGNLIDLKVASSTKADFDVSGNLTFYGANTLSLKGDSDLLLGDTAQLYWDTDRLRVITSGGTGDLVIMDSGYIGIGTTTPSARVAISSTAQNGSDLLRVASTTNANLFAIQASGMIQIGNQNALKYNSTTGTIDVFNGLGFGSTINLESDSAAGGVRLVNVPVGIQTAATANFYTFAIDNIDILTIYAQADGSNGIQNIGVAIGTTTASALLFVEGQATDRVSLKVRGESGQTSDLLQLASSTNSNLLIVDKNGKMGIGTSTAEFMLDIYQNAGTATGTPIRADGRFCMSTYNSAGVRVYMWITVGNTWGLSTKDCRL